MTEIVESRTPEQWASVVRADLGQAVTGFVAAGQHLRDAKVQIPQNAWESWVRTQVDISPATASKLMSISQHVVINNFSHVKSLPPSWGTLYELSKMVARDYRIVRPPT